jgi:hypothetical protein
MPAPPQCQNGELKKGKKKGMREVRTVHKWEKNSELKEREKMG